MKTIFKVNFDGIYTNIEKVEVESTEVANSYLKDFDYEYFKTFIVAKKAALEEMVRISKDWNFAVKEMRKQTKENY